MKKLFVSGILLLSMSFLLTNCTKEEMPDPNPNPDAKTGTAQFEITDAPIDDANVQGCFVTVTEVKVDGEVISDFEGKMTIDLLAYQNGDVKSLGLAELETGTYSNISLVLDHETDANGNSPGCYILTTDNTKHNLQASANSTSELTLNTSPFEIKENSNTNIVLDFDVRKAVKREANNANDQYNFVTEAELKSSVRTVNKSETGEVNGQCSDDFNVTSKIVVYAYKKGEYNKQTETSGQGSSQIMFKNAVSSAVADSNGNYTLAFLQEGEYELHFFGYEDENNDGQMELQGELKLGLLGNLGVDLNSVNVEAGVDLSVDISISGILP